MSVFDQVGHALALTHASSSGQRFFATKVEATQFVDALHVKFPSVYGTWTSTRYIDNGTAGWLVEYRIYSCE